MSQIAKTPKKTAEIKKLLEDYARIQRRIDNAEERIAFLESSLNVPSSPNLSGMPGGSCDRSSKQERDYIKKEELEATLGVLNAEESRRREEIEGMLEHMENPDERTAIEMRYLDRASWRAVSTVLYGNEPDYDEHERRYLKRTFKIHGSALQTLARLCPAQ